MSQRPGKKFIGAYIAADTKAKLQKIAESQDRPVAYIVEKILAEGVLHLKGKQPEAAK